MTDRLTVGGNLIAECRSCGHKFSIAEGEIKFYQAKGLNLPTHCSVCRRLKKANKTDGRKPVFTEDGLLNITEDVGAFDERTAD